MMAALMLLGLLLSNLPAKILMLRVCFMRNLVNPRYTLDLKAQGDVIITMDADLQDSRRDSGLYNMITTQNFDLVSGWKKKRYDSVVATYLLNYLIGLKTSEYS
jgi:hypothetical protein